MQSILDEGASRGGWVHLFRAGIEAGRLRAHDLPGFRTHFTRVLASGGLAEDTFAAAVRDIVLEIVEAPAP